MGTERKEMDKGFIKIYRKMKEWKWYDDIPTKVLFLHLLISANWEDKEWHKIKIKRGQLLTSQNHLAEETQLSRQQVRRAINNLISTKEITKSTTSTYTIITVLNYDEYQSINQVENQRTTKSQPSRNQVATTTKELKELKEVKEYVVIGGVRYRANDPNRPLTIEERKELGLV